MWNTLPPSDRNRNFNDFKSKVKRDRLVYYLNKRD